jgi:serine/threonine-protein kinase
VTIDEPTEPLGAVPGGLRLDQQPAPDGLPHGLPDGPPHGLPDGPPPGLPDGPPERPRGRVGEHRRQDGPDRGPRRWPLVAILCVLAVLAVSGLARLATSSLPHPSSAGQAVPGPTTEDQLSTPDATSTDAPLFSDSNPATPTDTPSVSAPASPFPSSGPTGPTGPTGAPTPTPTRSARPSPTAPALVAVPSVVGKPQSAATSNLSGAGFVVAVVKSTTTDRRQFNRVLSQSPSAGTMARKGTTVTIVVAVGGTH